MSTTVAYCRSCMEPYYTTQSKDGATGYCASCAFEASPEIGTRESLEPQKEWRMFGGLG